MINCLIGACSQNKIKKEQDNNMVKYERKDVCYWNSYFTYYN